MKYFIITVDTEGDNLWEYKKGQVIQTLNSRFLPRFQNLCNDFGFKPVWLTNYEMIMDDFFVEFAKKEQTIGNCEIGIHIHAWNNPPIYNLKTNFAGNSFLIEYPNNIMEEKFKTTYDLIKTKIEKAPFSHRAGRWVMNDDYFRLLEKYGVLVDCSYTPGISWEKTEGESYMCGSNYKMVNPAPHFVRGVLEVPMTIRKSRIVKGGSFKHKIYSLLFGNYSWLRPAITSIEDILDLIKRMENKEDNTYLEFMIHSSELMPGGSPYFRTNESIENLYHNIEKIFKTVSLKGYKSITLEEFYYVFKRSL